MSFGNLLTLSAVGIYFHAIYISITLGLPLTIIFLLLKYNKTGSEAYFRAAKISTIILMMNFGLGAITGTLVEFGLVQIWPGTILAIATSALMPMALELIAFVMEVALLVLFYVTLGKFSAKKSAVIITAYWFFAVLSGILITSVNSWLVSPWGTGNLAEQLYPFMPTYGPAELNLPVLFAIKVLLISTGLPLQSIIQDPSVAQKIGLVINDPYVALKNPYNYSSVIHNITAAVIIGMSIATLAWSFRFYKTGDRKYIEIISAFFVPFLVLMVLQPTLFGHLMGTSVVEYNPTKFSMMEGAMQNVSDPLMGLLAYGNPNQQIPGLEYYINSCNSLRNLTLNDIATSLNLTADKIYSIAETLGLNVSNQAIKDTLSIKASEVCINDLNADKSLVQTIHTLYYTKITGGAIALIASLAMAGLLYSIPLITPISKMIEEKIFRNNRRLSIFALSLLISFGAATAAVLGWYVREVGRKPWTVYGILYPSDVSTSVSYAYSSSFLLLAFSVIVAVNLLGMFAMAFVALKGEKVSEQFSKMMEKIRGGNDGQ